PSGGAGRVTLGGATRSRSSARRARGRCPESRGPGKVSADAAVGRSSRPRHGGPGMSARGSAASRRADRRRRIVTTAMIRLLPAATACTLVLASLSAQDDVPPPVRSDAGSTEVGNIDEQSGPGDEAEFQRMEGAGVEPAGPAPTPGGLERY